MDLASGYSDSINYGNGYTPLANNAINNNNAAYNTNQAYANQVGQYDPFAQSGGFGAQTDYYSGLGRDYTTATGGNIFGNASGGSVFDTGAPGIDVSTLTPQQKSYYDSHMRTYGYAPQNDYFRSGQYDKDYGDFGRYVGGGIGSDAARAPNQPAITPQQTYVGGYDPYSPQTFAPSAQQNVGETSVPSATLTPQQRSYYDSHMTTYGYAPPPDYFSSGQYDRDYGQFGRYNPQANRDTLANQMAGGSSFNDRFSAAPAIQPGLQPLPGDLPAGVKAGVDPGGRSFNMSPNTPSTFDRRFYDPYGGAQPETPADFPGWVPPKPAEPWTNAS